MWPLLVGIGIAACVIIFLAQKFNDSPNSSRTTTAVRSGTDSMKPQNSFDLHNLPDTVTDDEREFLYRVATFNGVRYVTDDHIKTYNLHMMNNLFQAMSGWDIWDESIHHAAGQYDRMTRAEAQEEIRILAYDPTFQVAMVKGQSGGPYITSGMQCSCMDFRKRQLPCKHMYKLAMELDGDVTKRIGGGRDEPLRFLDVALAGRFPGGYDGIRSKITKLGGIWSDTITNETDILVTGKAPSAAKLQAAAENGIMILKEDDVEKLFV